MFFKSASQCRLDMKEREKERENRQQSTTTNNHQRRLQCLLEFLFAKKRGGENSVFIRCIFIFVMFLW
jgi:hypothetical protein